MLVAYKVVLIAHLTEFGDIFRSNVCMYYVHANQPRLNKVATIVSTDLKWSDLSTQIVPVDFSELNPGVTGHHARNLYFIYSGDYSPYGRPDEIIAKMTILYATAGIIY